MCKRSYHWTAFPDIRTVVYLVVSIVSVLNPYHKVNGRFSPLQDSESLVTTIKFLHGGSHVDPADVPLHQITSETHKSKTVDLIDRDEDEVKRSLVLDLSQPGTNSCVPLATRLESTIKPPRNPISHDHIKVLADSYAPINNFPTRLQSNAMIEGWALLFETQNPQNDSKKENYAYKPKEISFRVNLNHLIGTGYWMNCYHSELIIDHQILKMVAKRNRCDHDQNNHLESYLKQSQLYSYASKVLIEFQQVIEASTNFGKEDKDLIAPLRFVENFIVFPDKGQAKLENLKDMKDCWFFEEELIGEYLKYVGNEDYSTSWIKNQNNDDFLTLNQPTQLGIALQAFTHWHFDQNAGSAVLGDLQGSGFILTDPAMVDLDHEWHRGNTKLEGIKGFIKTHKCNRWCTHLGLPTDLTYPIHETQN